METRCAVIENVVNGNTVKVRYYDDLYDFNHYEEVGIADQVQKNMAHLCVGDTVALMSEYQTIDPRRITAIRFTDEAIGTNENGGRVAEFTLDGDPFTVQGSGSTALTVLCGNPQQCGGTDGVYSVYHTGVAHRANTNTNTNVQSWIRHFRRFVYRGIEDVWGNIYTQLCGIGRLNGEWRYTFDPSLYNSDMTDWESVSFEMPEMINPAEAVTGNPYWITYMGYDSTMPIVLLAKGVNYSNGNVGTLTGRTRYGGTFKTTSGDHKFANAGGGWDHTFRGGLFMMRLDSGTTYGVPYWLYGNRPVRHVER